MEKVPPVTGYRGDRPGESVFDLKKALDKIQQYVGELERQRDLAVKDREISAAKLALVKDALNTMEMER